MTPNQQQRGFYGWYALSGAMMVTLVSIGAFLISFGVFLPLMNEDLGWSRASISFGITLGQALNGLPSPLWGILVTRYGPRAIMIVGTLIMTAGLAAMALIQEPWHMYVFYGIAGIGAGMAGMVSTSTLANNWFHRKRSLALSLIISAGCIGGFAFPPLTTAVSAAFGWRVAWLVLAAIVLVLATGVGSICLARNRPEDIGQVPDGEAASSPDDANLEAAALASGNRPAGWQLNQVMRNPTTWLIGLFVICYAVALGTVSTHQVAYMKDLGFSAMIGATTLSLVSGMAIIGSLSFGTLAMKYNLRYLAGGGFALQILALVILLTSENLTLIYVFSILFGISNGALLTSLPTFLGAYYGRECYPRVVGILSPFQIVAQAGAASAAGLIYDTTGAYTLAFIIVTIMSVVGMASALLARKPQPSGV